MPLEGENRIFFVSNFKSVFERHFNLFQIHDTMHGKIIATIKLVVTIAPAIAIKK